jgi:hypothetical protein
LPTFGQLNFSDKMTLIDFEHAVPEQLITHHVGNKLREEDLKLSNDITDLSDETAELLMKHFLNPVKTEELYAFSQAVQLDYNAVYKVSQQLFARSSDFIALSKDLARLLYEQSVHPKIKAGELNIVRIKNARIDGETADAIGIFKSETSVPFLKMQGTTSGYTINHDYGFEIKGVDKGCIIFNTLPAEGFRVLVIDNLNKTNEAQYWKDDFLEVKPVNNEYHQTNGIMNIAKNFVTNQLSEEFEVSKADQIDLLNRSVDYFKKHDSFDREEFAGEVFIDVNVMESFKKFDQNFRQENELELSDNFEISAQAVKKQARIFKSVLKLDKNFHIYIHGDRNLIEQGVDEDGRKFYKIYFREES